MCHQSQTECECVCAIGVIIPLAYSGTRHARVSSLLQILHNILNAAVVSTHKSLPPAGAQAPVLSTQTLSISPTLVELHSMSHPVTSSKEVVGLDQKRHRHVSFGLY